MRLKSVLGLAAVLALAAVASEAAVSRVVVVQAPDAAAYVKSIERVRQTLIGILLSERRR